jgi:hypothetical protein
MAFERFAFYQGFDLRVGWLETIMVHFCEQSSRWAHTARTAFLNSWKFRELTIDNFHPTHHLLTRTEASCLHRVRKCTKHNMHYFLQLAFRGFTAKSRR